MEAGSSRVANGNVQVGAAVEGENAVSSRVAESGSSTGTGRVGIEAGSSRVVEGARQRAQMAEMEGLPRHAWRKSMCLRAQEELEWGPAGSV